MKRNQFVADSKPANMGEREVSFEYHTGQLPIRTEQTTSRNPREPLANQIEEPASEFVEGNRQSEEHNADLQLGYEPPRTKMKTTCSYGSREG